MNAKLLLAATLAGALTLYAWESLSNAALPWHRATMRSFADSNAVVQAVKAQAPENGLYVDARGVVAAVSFQPDMSDRSSLLGSMLGTQLVLDLIVALVFLLAMQRVPRMTTLQYMAAFAVAAFAISLSTFASNWVWWGYPAAWTLVQVLDRTIGFALMGLAMGATFNTWSPRVTTDEWGGVRASGGLPASRSAPSRGART
jgi:hypothetical protein